jgi:hypothetical protein
VLAGEHDVREGADKNVGDRDYVRVNFLVEADAPESEAGRGCSGPALGAPRLSEGQGRAAVGPALVS